MNGFDGAGKILTLIGQYVGLFSHRIMDLINNSISRLLLLRVLSEKEMIRLG